MDLIEKSNKQNFMYDKQRNKKREKKLIYFEIYFKILIKDKDF